MSYFYMPNNYIYALTDPRGYGFVYIGRAKNPKNRIHMHLRPKDGSRRAQWIKELLALGLEPVMTVLEEVSFDDIKAAEDKAIASCRAIHGVFCLNDNAGTHKYRQQVSA